MAKKHNKVFSLRNEILFKNIIKYFNWFTLTFNRDDNLSYEPHDGYKGKSCFLSLSLSLMLFIPIKPTSIYQPEK